jgi:hypothetical protein
MIRAHRLESSSELEDKTVSGVATMKILTSGACPFALGEALKIGQYSADHAREHPAVAGGGCQGGHPNHAHPSSGNIRGCRYQQY